MALLSPDKAGKLRALLGSLPDGMADRLCAVARDGDPALGRLLDYCCTDPDTAARRRFFAPLEPLSGDPDLERPSRAYTPESLLAVLWSWIRDDLDPDAADAAFSAAADFDDPGGAGVLDEVRARASGAILGALDAVKDDPKEEKRLRKKLCVQDFQPFHDAAVLLRVTPVIRTALVDLPLHINDLSEALSATIRDRYDTAVELDADAGVWLLFILMARLERPWRLLRVFERIARREDDFLLSRTDMSVIGDALLTDAEHHLTRFEQSPDTLDEARDAAQALVEFAAVTVGMTREIGIRKDGAWGQRLFALRSKASDQMTRTHEAARQAVQDALPEVGGARRRRAAPPAPGEPGFDKAEALIVFLVLTKDDAGRAAVGGAHATVMQDLRELLESAGQSVLAGMRASSDTAEQAEAQTRLDHVARLMKAMGENESASVLVRRAAAALAA